MLPFKYDRIEAQETSVKFIGIEFTADFGEFCRGEVYDYVIMDFETGVFKTFDIEGNLDVEAEFQIRT